MDSAQVLHEEAEIELNQTLHYHHCISRPKHWFLGLVEAPRMSNLPNHPPTHHHLQVALI